VLFSVLFVCNCVLPPGDNPIAVNEYIISYQCSVRCTVVIFPVLGALSKILGRSFSGVGMSADLKQLSNI
jgi:hypothetical protein